MARGSFRIALGAVALVSLPIGGRAEQPFASRAVSIEVSIAGPSVARVRERYALDSGLGAPVFETLDDPCSTMGPVSASVGQRHLAFDISHQGPWTILRGSGSSASGGELDVSYDVKLGGRTVPIVLPSAPLARVAGLRGADVDLRVVFAREIAGGSVSLPRLDRRPDGHTWSALLAAIPSLVRIEIPFEPGDCGRRLTGTTGGLEWRFWVFVLTMAVWIPAYFWWFGRRDGLR